MMLNTNHPSAILRQAWCCVRLDAIRLAVEATIAELETHTREEALADFQAGHAPRATFVATVAALMTCCNELRDESGMARVESHAAHQMEDVDWAQRYTSDVDRYRTAAGACLTRLLNL